MWWISSFGRPTEGFLKGSLEPCAVLIHNNIAIQNHEEYTWTMMIRWIHNHCWISSIQLKPYVGLFGYVWIL